MELHTTWNLGPLVGAHRQHWLRAEHGQGTVDGASGTVAVHHPTDPTESPWVFASTDDSSRGRLSVAGAAATVELMPDATRQAAWHRHTVTLQVHADQGAVGAVQLAVPRVRQLPFGGFPELESAWALGEVRVDGERVQPVVVAQRPQSVHLALPVSLAEGASVQVQLGWVDRQRYAHAVERGVGAPTGTSSTLQPVGTTTGLVSVFPTLVGPRSASAPIAATVEVGSPAGLKAHRAVVGGSSPSVTVRSGWQWTRVTSSYPGATAALGRWPERSVEDAVAEGPQLWLRTEPHGPVAQAARRLTALQRGAFGVSEPPQLQVVELHGVVADVGFDVSAGGLVAFRPYVAPSFHADDATRFADLVPSLSTWVLGYGLMGGRLADRGVDDALTRAVGGAAATLTVQGASGAEVAAPWWRMQQLAAAPWEGRQRGGWGRVFTLGHSLPSLVGYDAVAGALGDVVEGRQPATWSGLAHALSARSGLPMTAVIATFVRAGICPRVDARLDGGEVHVTTDVPFGEWYVPVEVRGGGQRMEGFVVVRDGEGVGAFDWPHPRPPTRVRVDPRQEWLLRRPEVVMVVAEEHLSPTSLTTEMFAPDGFGVPRRDGLATGMRLPQPLDPPSTMGE
jgi:hypothetical protein